MTSYYEDRYHSILLRASELLKQKNSVMVEFGDDEKTLRKQYMTLLRRAAKYRKHCLQKEDLVVFLKK
jgi:hypothetical protein